jgi:hypothetical protein
LENWPAPATRPEFIELITPWEKIRRKGHKGCALEVKTREEKLKPDLGLKPGLAFSIQVAA